MTLDLSNPAVSFLLCLALLGWTFVSYQAGEQCYKERVLAWCGIPFVLGCLTLIGVFSGSLVRLILKSL